MSTAAHRLPITAAEYLEGELRAEIRHEFVDGRIYQTNPFPEDVKRPWYHLNRIED